MQDNRQNYDAMHKDIMLIGQSVDNAADSKPASDNMSYVNLWEGKARSYPSLCSALSCSACLEHNRLPTNPTHHPITLHIATRHRPTARH